MKKVGEGLGWFLGRGGGTIAENIGNVFVLPKKKVNK